jgi:hypothetical protein
MIEYFLKSSFLMIVISLNPIFDDRMNIIIDNMELTIKAVKDAMGAPIKPIFGTRISINVNKKKKEAKLV